MKYLILDRDARPLACLLFGSAALKTLPRDQFIGWDQDTRKANLHLITNNMRFLILPWVKVPHLASHILGRVARRISSDWIKRYNHPIGDLCREGALPGNLLSGRQLDLMWINQGTQP